MIAAVLIARAKRGDVRAASEIADRAEGRPSQSLNLQGRMELSTIIERRARLEVLIHNFPPQLLEERFHQLYPRLTFDTRGFGVESLHYPKGFYLKVVNRELLVV